MRISTLLKVVCTQLRHAWIFVRGVSRVSLETTSHLLDASYLSKRNALHSRASIIFAVGLIQAISVQAQTISTAVGNGSQGFSGDSYAAVEASINYARGVEIDANGNIYIADTGNHRIRKITPTGIINTVAGNGIVGSTGDGGSAINASLSNPTSVAADANGNFYIADTYNNRIRKVTPDGIITTIAGTGVSGPNGIAAEADGTLYIADSGNNRIRKITPEGIVTTVAGTGTAGYSGDGGIATEANLNIPYGVAVGTDGSLYIADTYNHRVRKVAPDGIINTVAGNGASGYSGDGGSAISARMAYPVDVALDTDGNVYIADTYNYRVRKVAPDGTISTVSGNGNATYNGDGGDASAATLNYPRSVAVYANGNLYIADTDNQRIREIIKPLPDILLTASPTTSVYGEPVSLVATITGNLTNTVASGTVTFLDGDTAVLCGPIELVDEMANCSVSYLTTATHNLSAIYSGDSAYAPNSGVVSHQVFQASTETSISTISPNPSYPGQKVTITAIVTNTVSSNGPDAYAPTGTVDISDTKGQCTTVLSNVGNGSSQGSCVLSRAALVPGDYTVTATYSGDTNFTSSDASTKRTVVKIRP